MPEEIIGKVSAFFAKPLVAGIDLSGGIKLGDTLHIQGHTSDVMVTVQSMQIDNKDVSEAKAGDAVGIKVPAKVRPGDTVYKITP